MYLVKALYGFNDGKEKVFRKPGDEFKVDKERLDVLLGNNSHKKAWVEIVEELQEHKGEKPKKKTTKKVDDKNVK